MNTNVEKIDRGPQVISRSLVVDVPADQIFARLEDPHRHHELDGSGTVMAKVKSPHQLKAGDTFTVNMKMFGLPYKITSTVVRFVNNRDIEWRHPAGHTWRWQLESLPNGQTRVTETWNYKESRATWLYNLIRLPRNNAKGIEQSLLRLNNGFSPPA